jgi:hypothetical protein
MYKRLYFALGAKKSEAVTIGDILPRLRQIAAQVRNTQWS